MKKYILLIFLFIFITACTNSQQTLKEVNNTQEIVISENIIEDTAPYYNFTQGETRDILGNKIIVNNIYQKAMVDLSVNGDRIQITNTKSEEIIDGLKMQIQVFHYNQKDPLDTYVTLKIEELELQDNEYLIKQNQRQTINNKDVILELSRGDGKITVSVYDKGTIIGDTKSIQPGETAEIYGLKITNEKSYYKITQYALITVE